MREKIIHWLSLTILFSSLFMCYGEVLSLFTGKMTEVTVIHTPFWIKGIKDMGLVLLSFFGLIFFNCKQRNIKGFLVYFFCVALLFWVSFLNNKYIALSGLRWILPFTACLLIAPSINQSFLEKLAVSLLIIFCIHFFVQLTQAVFYFNIDAFLLQKKGIFLGFLDRPPGIFLMPNTAGFFAVLTWFFAGRFISDKKIAAVRYLIPVSILMTKSGTGYVAFLGTVFLENMPKISWKVVLSVIVCSVLVLLGLEYALNRPELIEKSLGLRLVIFFRSLMTSELISTRFGYGSITAVLLARNFHISEPVPILDSTWSAILVNCGLIPFLAAGLLFSYILWLSYRINRMDVLSFFFILFCFGSTNSLFEAFPMNFLCSVLGIYYVKELWRSRMQLEAPGNAQSSFS